VPEDILRLFQKGRRILMLRTMFCVALALFVCTDLAVAKEKKAHAKSVIGTIKAVDADAGTVTVTVMKKKVPEDLPAFTVADSTTVTITNADGTTKDLTGKAGLKDPVVKEGASVKVTSAADGTVTKVEVGGTYAKPKHKKKAA
jgi:hypothetical protein